MNKMLLLSIFFTGVQSVLTAQTVKLFHENVNQITTIYANNSEFYPVSLALDVDLTNMIFSGGDKKIYVVPPRNEKFKIGELTIAEKGRRSSFGYKFKSTPGDVTISSYDKSFEYDLPFQKGKSYLLFQGYNGKFSHQHENSIDFTMPEGSEILAARDGIVVQVVKNNSESCPREECNKYNNYIMVMHADGTFANYVHIKYNGTNFRPGDKVKKGDIIAYSGNVGWTSGPHLHFVCFLGAFGKLNSLETPFRVDKGEHAIVLKEGNAYFRDY